MKRRRTAAGGALLGTLLGAAVLFGSSCRGAAINVPVTANASFTGFWTGSATRSPCRGGGSGEDWTTVSATFFQAGQTISGNVKSADGFDHPVSGTITGTIPNGTAFIDVGGLPGTSTCSVFQLFVNSFGTDAAGNLVTFSGTLTGRCCGTVAGTFRFDRTRAARRS